MFYNISELVDFDGPVIKEGFPFGHYQIPPVLARCLAMNLQIMENYGKDKNGIRTLRKPP